MTLTRGFKKKVHILNNYWYMGTPRRLQLLNLKRISKSSMSLKIVLGRNSNTEGRTEFKTGLYGMRRKKPSQLYM